MFCITAMFVLVQFFGFYSAVVEVPVLRCNAMSLDNWFLTFGDDIVVLSSRVDVVFILFWTLNDP